MSRRRKKGGKKIAVLGTTPSRAQGPINDMSWELWTIGPGGHDLHRWDRLYEIHGVDLMPDTFEEYLANLKKAQPPQQVITLQPQPDWPANRPIDRDRLFEAFHRRMWFSSSIGYALGEAILEEPDEIGCWGIDLESGEEYVSQFVGAAHLIDIAKERGIRITMPEHCGLLRDPAPYPDRWETHFALTIESKIQFLDRELAKANGEYEGIKAAAARLEGRLACLHELGATDKTAEAEKQLRELHGRLGEVTAKVNVMTGELGASKFYRTRFVVGSPE